MTPFDWTKSICETKIDLIKDDPLLEKEYNAFMVNRALSYYPDTILFAAEMNRYPNLDRKMQYDFYLRAISKRKRFSKWAKKPPESNDVKLIMNHYDYSQNRATEALSLLSEDQLIELRALYDIGGK